MTAPIRTATVVAPSAMPEVLRFMRVLWGVVHAVEKTSKRMNGEIGVTGPQRLVLRVIGLFPGVSAGEVAGILHVHPSTLTGILRRLVAQGLVERVDAPHDRRRAVLRLTVAGVHANAVRRGTVESAIADALAGVTDRDRAVTVRVLARLAEHLERASLSRSRPAARPANAPPHVAGVRNTLVRGPVQMTRPADRKG